LGGAELLERVGSDCGRRRLPVRKRSPTWTRTLGMSGSASGCPVASCVFGAGPPSAVVVVVTQVPRVAACDQLAAARAVDGAGGDAGRPLAAEPVVVAVVAARLSGAACLFACSCMDGAAAGCRYESGAARLAAHPHGWMRPGMVA
jgi:hypothetical protein